MVVIFMMSGKLATVGLLKMKIFWIKSYDVIIYVDDVTGKISSCNSNYVADVVIWPKFSICGLRFFEFCEFWSIPRKSVPHKFCFCSSFVKKLIPAKKVYLQNSFSKINKRLAIWIESYWTLWLDLLLLWKIIARFF